jgi:hypothetical protein
MVMVAARAKINRGEKKEAKIKGGGTKRKGFQLNSLGDAFLWNPNTNGPKNLK